MRVLVTGAKGRVGSTVAHGLIERGHTVRAHDIVACSDFVDKCVSDLTDFAAVLAATKGMDAIVHLGGDPGGGASTQIEGSDGSWQSILNSNIIGSYNVFEAARQAGVRRIAYASRAGVLGDYPEDDPKTFRTVTLPTTPKGDYTVSKVFGEALGYSYAHQHNMEVVCVRIGNFNGIRTTVDHPHQLSNADCINVFERAIVHPGVKYEIVFGVSDSTWPLYDLDHGRQAIGYYPQDKSVILPAELPWNKTNPKL